ncbi:MAG: winged helix-turn-helix transcriptional regulator [Verrucomicrobiota bacterium]
MPAKKARFIPLSDRKAYHRFEDVIGCKWSTLVVAAMPQGVTGPGELERCIPGIFTKVLNERLRKLADFQVLSRVDYALTDSGSRLAALLEQVPLLNAQHPDSAS